VIEWRRLPLSRPSLVTGKPPSFPALFETVPEPIGPAHFEASTLERVPVWLLALAALKPGEREERAVKAILLLPRKGRSEFKAETQNGDGEADEPRSREEADR